MSKSFISFISRVFVYGIFALIVMSQAEAQTISMM